MVSAANSNGESANSAEVTATPPVPPMPAPPAGTALLDFDGQGDAMPSPDSSGFYWNNISTVANTVGGSVLPLNGSSQPIPLVNATNGNSGWTLAINQLGPYGFDANSAPEGDDWTGPYPAAVASFPQTALAHGFTIGGPISVTLSGFNSGSNYNLLIYGAYAAGGQTIQTNTLTVGTSPSPAINTFNVPGNSTTAVGWTNVTPGAGGQIVFTIASSSVGALNFMEVSPTSTNASTSSLPPAAPAILTVTTNYGQVCLTWSAVATATSYNVKRSTASSAETNLASTASTSFTDTNVVGGTKYYYVVSAVNNTGEGTNSAEVTATPISPAVLYQEDWGTTNGGTNVTVAANVGWNQVLSSGFSSGFWQANGAVDDSTGAGLPANSMWFGDNGTNLAMFYTTNGAGSGTYGDSAFTSIDPTLYPNLKLSVYAEWGWNGGALQSWFAVQVGGVWYVSTNHPVIPNQAGGINFHRTDMIYSPAAINWNNLTVNSSVAIGGQVATALSGPITGIGLVAQSTGGWWNVNELQVALAATAPTTLGSIVAGTISGNSLTLNWTASPNVHLQSVTNLAPPVVWSDVPNTTGQGLATITITNNQRFFRLVQP